MATIEKRVSQDGSISYRVKVRLKGYPAQSASFVRVTDARKWAAATESAIREGRYFETREAKKRTVADLFEKYRAEVLPRLRSQDSRTVHLNWWESKLGAYSLADVRPVLIVETRKALFEKETPRKGPAHGKTLSESTVNRYCSTLSHAYTWAVKELQWVNDNPCFKIKSYKESEGVIRFLSDDERGALLLAAQEQGGVLYTILVLALSTGARRNELLKLTWPDVDLKAGLLTFPLTKNGKVRSVPITGHALELLENLAADRMLKAKIGLVFPGKTARTKSKPLAIENVFQAALKAARIENFRFHDLPHSAASYLIMAGVDMRTVAEILGHSYLKMTQRYAHLSRAHVSDAVSKLDAAIFGAGI